MRKIYLAVAALSLTFFTISCSKSSGGEEPGDPIDNSTSFALKVGGTAYTLDSFIVTETSQGYYIRASQKGNTNNAYGVSLFINTKSSNSSTSFGKLSEAGKIFVGASLGTDKNVTSTYTNPANGTVTTSNGTVNVVVSNSTITAAVNTQLYDAVTGTPVSFEFSLRTPTSVQPTNNPSQEFFDFEFNGATYNLRALSAAAFDKGYLISGLASNNQSVAIVINTKTSDNSIPFGDLEESGKASASFNLPNESVVYLTTGQNCQGQDVHNQGNAKLTSIGNIGGYVEGYISGSAYKNENACGEGGRTVDSKPFTGYFKIRRFN
ncbi:hypothetical protein [Flavisolibacter tropicus]|uniref:Uncharacterized protein n=1 Tax=Flavisolibacter tropicus TaxID=1492898 RepID=A0A172TSR7_9BACT|nr:hypothetical protein [Flavisolibacter tropicus]ANE50125.1 hypothetical protein SY85_06050 [Flavisolibacter tropicus]